MNTVTKTHRNLAYIDAEEFANFHFMKNISFGLFDSPYTHYYFIPPSRLTSHVIWGGSYIFDEYKIGNAMLEDQVESRFANIPGRKYIFEPSPTPSTMGVTEKFEFSMLYSVMASSGYCQDIMVITGDASAIFCLNESCEFMIYSRDIAAFPAPFEGVSDKELIQMFIDQAENFSTHYQEKRINHLNKNILPHCLEPLI